MLTDRKAFFFVLLSFFSFFVVFSGQSMKRSANGGFRFEPLELRYDKRGLERAHLQSFKDHFQIIFRSQQLCGLTFVTSSVSLMFSRRESYFSGKVRSSRVTSRPQRRQSSGSVKPFLRYVLLKTPGTGKSMKLMETDPEQF